jgi:hypothetical protein
VRAARPALALLVLALGLVAASPVAAARKGGPTGLHAFLLRADEPRADSYAKTPSFAWNPVAGAVRYEFQLSTSTAFRESGIVYADAKLTTPVAAPSLTLPWITGSPHSLYARVRAVLAKSTTDWSAPFGFDMQPAAAPKPLPGYPGLLRWSPVDGATGYQVWFVDIPKFVFTYSNVVDEREFYTFHQAGLWIGQVRWRVRALRIDFGDQNGPHRANQLPASGAGPWSPIYRSVNPPFSLGQLKPVATVSDVVSSGSKSSPAHRLMPGFAFGGDQTDDAIDAELYRVYVFTDKQCLNRVYTSAIVGSPAYAPRPYGGLGLPSNSTGLSVSRSSYLGDGAQGPSYTYDGELADPSEAAEQATPTTGLPAGQSTTDGKAAPAPGSDPKSSGSGTTTSTVSLIKVDGKLGAPVDLWDTNWPEGGYYWTVVPVEAKAPDTLKTSVASPGVSPGSGTLPVLNGTGFSVGDVVQIGNPGNQEPATVTGVNGNVLSFAQPLKFGHGTGEPVVRLSGNLVYRDLELAQDVCAEGRVMRFGKESEPTLTSSGEPFVSGLSSSGRLTSARTTEVFYGAPLVAWTSALDADVYEVQWSKTAKPFTPETDPGTNALGMMRFSNSAVLPLGPGKWYYRVRGFDFSLPTGAQSMSWSDPQEIVVAKPKFRVVP